VGFANRNSFHRVNGLFNIQEVRRMSAMAKKKMSGLNIFLWSALALIVASALFFFVQSLDLVGGSDTVWVPAYGKVACEQTRLECFPGSCSDSNPEFKSISSSGESVYCGAPTLTDANYYHGCVIHIKKDGGFFDFTSIQVCNKDGTNCQSKTMIPETSTFWGTQNTQSLTINAGQKAFINPNLASYSYAVTADVFGLTIEGALLGYQYSDRCNIASLLNAKQIATLKGSPDYVKTIQAGEISPQNFPVVFITGYLNSYKDQRIITIGQDSWFIQDIGYRCKVAKDTNDRFVVTDECTSDNSIECYPNIGNCDKNGKIMSSNDPSQKACVPGTLIGSATSRQAISTDKACKTRCASSGVPENYDCVTIGKCSDGKVLNQNYDCVESTKLDEKQICESKGGKYTETALSDGKVSKTCDYAGQDLFIVYIILGVFAIIIVMLLVKMSSKKKKR
jgi:hypothetical protein